MVFMVSSSLVGYCLFTNRNYSPHGVYELNVEKGLWEGDRSALRWHIGVLYAGVND